jgi:ribosomal protein L37AE/L43A
MISRTGMKSESCVVCARRAGASAVGRSPRLGWYCTECDVQIARAAIDMVSKQFDVVEQFACQRVATIINSTDDDVLIIQREDVALFVSWVVDEFAKQMREYFKTPDGGQQ